MKYSRSDEVLLIKLEDGEDVHSSLIEICDREDFRTGWVYSGIGILREFTLGYFMGREYSKKYFEEPHELLSMSGSVTLDTEVPLHLHTSLSSRQFGVVGGHLFRGTVNVLNEIMIKKLPENIRLRRTINPTTSNYELDILE